MRKLIVLSLIFLISLILSIPAYGDKLTDYDSKKSTVSKKLDKVTKQQSAVKKKIEQKTEEKKSLISAEQKKTQEYNSLKAQKKQLDQVLLSMDIQLNESEKRYEDQKELLKKRLKVMYENSNVTYIQTIIESKSLTDFFERLQIIFLIARNDKELVKSLDEAKKDVEYKKLLKEKQLHETDRKARENANVLATISISRADIEDELQNYKDKLKNLETQEDELIRQSEAINREIKGMMSKSRYSGGFMRWPISLKYTTVTSSFGRRFHPVLRKYKVHTGIDIRSDYGVSITAAANGRVIVAGWKNGYGNTVIIDHGGGIATLYGHASKLLVHTGDYIRAGQTIAKVGATGWTTGKHLHFEVIKNGVAKNPLNYVTSR